MGNAEEQDSSWNWGGEMYGPMLYSMQKGFKGKGKNFSWTPYTGWQKGGFQDFKGKGKGGVGTDGKGGGAIGAGAGGGGLSMQKGSFTKGGQGEFQGYCDFCGAWGHRQNTCWKKTQYMNQLRAQGGKGLGKSVAELQVDSNPWGADNASGQPQQGDGGDAGQPPLVLCHVGLTARSPPPGIVHPNRFGALQSEEADYGDDYDMRCCHGCRTEPITTTTTTTSTTTEKNDEWAVKVKQGPKRSQKQSKKSRVIDYLNRVKGGFGDEGRRSVPVQHLLPTAAPLLGAQTITKVENGVRWRKVQGVIDSGAGENVSQERDLGNAAVTPSLGSRTGVTYEAADGQQIRNRGEVTVKGVLENGDVRWMTFQACNVSRPLLSVGRICEAGNKVTFEEDWATITHKKTGKSIHAPKVNGVYVLEFWVPDHDAADFPRPGM